MVDFDFERLKAEFLEGVNSAAESVSSAARDVSDDVKRFKRFIELGRDLFVSHAITSHGGNISETNGKSIWISCSGAMLGHLTPGAIVETAWAVDARDARASTELVVHRAMYQAFAARLAAAPAAYPAAYSATYQSAAPFVAPIPAPVAPENAAGASPKTDSPVNCTAAIVHAHPAHTIARSLIDDEIRPIDAEGKLVCGERIPVVRVEKAVASIDVARCMAKLVAEGVCMAVVAGHGPFAIAATLEDAFRLISCLERSAEILDILDRTNQTRKC